MRGRGRARFKGNNSPSPGPGNRNGSGDNGDRWGHDRYSPEPGNNCQTPTYSERQAKPGTINASSRSPCQQNDDRSSPFGRQIRNDDQRSPTVGCDGPSARARKPERPRNRRPDVQVYVPRARRQQPGQNGPENQVTPEHTEVKPQVVPVRQKKKEMERYIPRGRLELQNKANSSSMQPSTEVVEENGNIDSVHKKIKVDGETIVNHPEVSASGFSEQIYDTNKIINDINDDKDFCDDKKGADVCAKTGDTEQEVVEDDNDNEENITTNTSQNNDAFQDIVNVEDVRHFHDSSLKKAENFSENNSLDCDIGHISDTGHINDRSDLNTVFNSIPASPATIPCLDTTNKLQESQGNSSNLLTESVEKDTGSIRNDFENKDIADVSDINHDDISLTGATVDEKLTCDAEKSSEGRDNLTQSKKGEVFIENPDESAFQPLQVNIDMGTIDKKFDNAEPDIGNESEILPDNNMESDQALKDGTNSNIIHHDEGCENPNGSPTKKNIVVDNAVGMVKDENSAEPMDYKISCEKSMMKHEDIEITGNLMEQPNNDEKVLLDKKQTDGVNINQSKSVCDDDQSDTVTNNSSQSKEEEDSWDTMFDDDGECLDPSAMEELTKTVGKVKIQKSKKINYLDYQPKDKSNFDFTQYEHIIEIYDFPVDFVTRDLIIAFQAFMSRGFDLKWVDDTHALGIFSSAIAANDALQLIHPLLKVRSLSQASKQSQNKAKRCTEFLQPYKPRPETSAMAARRLVAGALGLATGVSKEKREMERKQLKEAKAKKRQERQNRENIWEYGKCAMDEET